MVDFAEAHVQNCTIFNLVHAHKPKFRLFFFFFGWPFAILFLALFLSFLSALLFSLSSTLHVLSVSHKKLGLNNGQRVEMGP